MENTKPIKIIISVSLVVGLFFGVLFVSSYVSPRFVERSATTLLSSYVKKAVSTKIDATLEDGALTNKAQVLLGKITGKEKAEELKQQLKTQAAKMTMSVVREAQASNFWEERPLIVRRAESIEQGFKFGTFESMKVQIATYIKTKYIEMAKKLMLEFRVFTGSSSAVFLLLCIAIYAQRVSRIHVLGPAVVLFISTGIVAYLYLFKQNWAHTILFNNYLGTSYLIFILMVFLYLGGGFGSGQSKTKKYKFAPRN